MAPNIPTRFHRMDVIEFGCDNEVRFCICSCKSFGQSLSTEFENTGHAWDDGSN